MSTEKHYTLVEAIRADGCPTKYKTKKETGRFSSSTPAASAKKAFSSLCERKRIHGQCSIYVSIRETTQGGKSKIFSYKGKRVLKKEPGPFGNKYDIHLKSVSVDELKEHCKKSHKTSGPMKSMKSMKKTQKSKRH
jgi:hypothetical protein